MNTHLKRCVGANDEMCKFPECSCAQTGLVGLPVINDKFLDSQLKCNLPIEMMEPIASVKLWAEYLKTGALVVVLGLVFCAVLLASVR
jgi:hypothetical protein